METIAGIAFYPLEMAKDGTICKPSQKTSIRDAVGGSGPDRVSDVVVISHGWNNDMAEARQLYDTLVSNMAALPANRQPAGGARPKLAIAGIFWPSKKFADDDLIPSPEIARVAAAAAAGRSVPTEVIAAKLDALKGTFDGPDHVLDELKKLLDRIEDSPGAQREFVERLRSLLPRPRDPLDDASDRFFSRPGDELLKDLAPPLRPSLTPAGGQGRGAAMDSAAPTGGTSGLGDVFDGIKAAAWRLLNYATYYQMKERAGILGGSLGNALAELRAVNDSLRIHLVGHSFGARLVTAAVAGSASFRPSSLTLLQAAFSHNGFTAKFDQKHDGFFRNVVAQAKVAGPIVVTHTVNDKAVGIAYPIASRVSGDRRTALGDATDVYGGLGRNGAVRMKADEVVIAALLDREGRYGFTPGKVHNLRADAYISGHGIVTNPAVANAVLAALNM
jgi:hypothetical protein